MKITEMILLALVREYGRLNNKAEKDAVGAQVSELGEVFVQFEDGDWLYSTHISDYMSEFDILEYDFSDIMPQC